jgi:hypothetical protein
MPAPLINCKTNIPARGFLFLKDPEESMLSDGGFEKQKSPAEHGGCFVFTGLKLREGRARQAGLGTPASYSVTALFSVTCRDIVL